MESPTTVVMSSTPTGDGFHAVFATAHDALDAAVATQLELVRSRLRRPVDCVCAWACTCEAEYARSHLDAFLAEAGD